MNYYHFSALYFHSPLHIVGVVIFVVSSNVVVIFAVYPMI